MMRHLHDLDRVGADSGGTVEVVIYSADENAADANVSDEDACSAGVPAGPPGSDDRAGAGPFGSSFAVDAGPAGAGSAGSGAGDRDPSAARWQRVLAGSALLIVVVGLLVGVRAATAHLPGRAQPAHWPTPPAVGSCLHLAGSAPVVINCALPHDAEVTGIYQAWDPVLADSPAASLAAACDDEARAYVGAASAGSDSALAGGKPEDPVPNPSPFSLSNPPLGVAPGDGTLVLGDDDAGTGGDPIPVVPQSLAYTGATVNAPADQRVGDRGWAVCVIQPEPVADYTGSVRGAVPADVPDAYRTCMSFLGSSVTCAKPHAAEVLGVVMPYSRRLPDDVAAKLRAAFLVPPGRNLGAGTAPTFDPQSLNEAMLVLGSVQNQVADAANAACLAAARSAIGTADPTYGGLLTVRGGTVLQAPRWQVTGDGFMAAGNGGSTSIGVTPDDGTDAPGGPMMLTAGGDTCQVSAPSGELITGTLIGRGGEPPTLTTR